MVVDTKQSTFCLYVCVLISLVCRGFDVPLLHARPAIRGSVEIREGPCELPKALIIGDSVAMGYAPLVAELLAGRVDVHWIPQSGQTTEYSLKRIGQWIRDNRWDVIHFNWGLDDLTLLQTSTETATKPRVPVNQYEENLRQLVRILKRQKTYLVWASTTPVAGSDCSRKAGMEIQYNAAARGIMDSYEIRINDLHKHLAPKFNQKLSSADSANFTTQGRRLLARQVADVLWEMCQPRLQVKFSTDVVSILDTDFSLYRDQDDWFDALIFATLVQIKHAGIILEHYATDKEESKLRELLAAANAPNIPIAKGIKQKLKYSGSKLIASHHKDGAQLILKVMGQTPELVRVICVGSLRNVAYAYYLNPVLFKKKIEAVWFVGGTLRSPRKPGNVDANVLRDPVAANIIFNRASVPLVWIPCTLDRVMQFDADQETELRGMRTSVARMLVESIDGWRASKGKAFMERTHQSPAEGKRMWSTCVNLGAAGLYPEWMGYVRGQASFSPERWTWFAEDPTGPDLMLVKRNEKAICNWVLGHFRRLPLAK